MHGVLVSCSIALLAGGGSSPRQASWAQSALSRWRTKVFELMVKLKNSEIEQHRIQQTCQQQVNIDNEPLSHFLDSQPLSHNSQLL